MRDGKNHGAGVARRRFLLGMSSGTVATIVRAGRPGVLAAPAATSEAPAKAGKKRSSVWLHRSRLPVLRKGDVVIIGGSVAGVAAALQFAQAGRKVVVAEHRNYLGREVSATLKPWVDLGRLVARGPVPEPIAACLKKMDANADAGELPLGMDAFKLSREGTGRGAGRSPVETGSGSGNVRLEGRSTSADCSH